MDNNINSRKNKHLNFKERTIIEIRLNDGFSPYKIANLYRSNAVIWS